jgi:hypothetical protein
LNPAHINGATVGTARLPRLQAKGKVIRRTDGEQTQPDTVAAGFQQSVEDFMDGTVPPGRSHDLESFQGGLFGEFARVSGGLCGTEFGPVRQLPLPPFEADFRPLSACRWIENDAPLASHSGWSG